MRTVQILVTLIAAFVCVLACASCSTIPKAPDPFDTMLGEAAASMFRDTQMFITPNTRK
jgi:hypothetical protein